MQRIGILGGTFDPPHIGHLILAQYTMESLDLDHVLFVPVGNHPHKEVTRTSADQRLTMLRLAIADNTAFSISQVDMNRPGPHYSADTVQIIQEQYPDASLYFVMGGDNLRTLPTWERARDLYACCRLAVMKRSDEKISPTMHEAILPGLAEKVDIVDAPMLGIWLSSTHVIERLRDGKSVRYIVPDAVRAYIEKENAYQKIGVK
jgi:nicotinate-nucleotide adenylyltransferase